MPINYGAPNEQGDQFAFGGTGVAPWYGNKAGGYLDAANSYGQNAQDVQNLRGPGVTNPYINQDLANTGSDLAAQRAGLQSLWRDANGLNGPSAGQRAIQAGTQQAANNQYALAAGMGGSAGALGRRNAGVQANSLNTQGANASNAVGAEDRAYALQRYTQGLGDLRNAGMGYQNSADQLAMAQGQINQGQQSANDALTLGWQGLGQQAMGAQLSADSGEYDARIGSMAQQQIAKQNAAAGQRNAMIGGGASAVGALIPLIASFSDIRGKMDIHGAGGRAQMNGRPFGGGGPMTLGPRGSMPMQRPPLQQALQMPPRPMAAPQAGMPMQRPPQPAMPMPMQGPPPPQAGMPMRPPMMPMQQPPMQPMMQRPQMMGPGMGRMMAQPMMQPQGVISDERVKHVAHELEMNPTAHGESYGRGLLAGPADPNRSYMPQDAYQFRQEQYPGIMSDEDAKLDAFSQGMKAGMGHVADPSGDYFKGVDYGREQGQRRSHPTIEDVQREYDRGRSLPPAKLDPAMEKFVGSLDNDPGVLRARAIAAQPTTHAPQATHMTEADHFLEHLHPYTYRYKDPSLEPSSRPNGGQYLGVMAQDVERAPGVGQQIVKNTPQGKMLEGGALMSALAAGVGRLHERVAQLEGGRMSGEKEKMGGKGGSPAPAMGAPGRVSEGTK